MVTIHMQTHITKQNNMKTKNILLSVAFAAASLAAFTSCEKVSPSGVLMAGTAVEDRVKMSNLYYQQYLEEDVFGQVEDEYTFVVGGDSHLTTDPGRLDEMFKIALDNEDLFVAHLGDIADTKPEYYIRLDSIVNEAKQKYVNRHFNLNSNGKYVAKTADGSAEELDFDEIKFPFFPVVGNHDITHNGWAMWSNIFHSSFYEFNIMVSIGDKIEVDHFIFLDTASGTLGNEQVNLINDGILDGEDDEFHYRHTFVFSHTNIFRPSSMQFASTFTREETYYLLKQFEQWRATIVFCGHVHKWDDREFAGVSYLTLDSMSERNSPNPGQYLVRVHVKKDGTFTWEKVMMNYVAKK